MRQESIVNFPSIVSEEQMLTKCPQNHLEINEEDFSENRVLLDNPPRPLIDLEERTP